MINATELSGDVVTGSTALAGLMLVYLDRRTGQWQNLPRREQPGANA